MKAAAQQMWFHMCKITHALEYLWEDECPYCGLEKSERKEKKHA